MTRRFQNNPPKTLKTNAPKTDIIIRKERRYNEEKDFRHTCVGIAVYTTYAAIAYYKIAQNAPVEVKAVNKMTLTDLIGDTFEFEKTDKKLKDNIEENMLAFFMDMNAKATPQATIPEGIDINTYFKANIFSYDRESIYRYYFSDGADNSWFIDGDGNIFQISSNHAKKFLDSIYARSLYPDSVVPEMIMDDQLIEPRMMKWEYRSQSNSFITAADIDNTTAEMKTYLLVGGRMNITFEWNRMQLMSRSSPAAVRYLMTYENVGNLNLKENDDAAITVTASGMKPPTAIIAAKRHITSIQRLPPSRYSISERVRCFPAIL